ncbi:MAG: IPT/TIG domain-containing protein, partial [Desulfuromonadales bacterium]|nr:IPT/TIG domain-containing protein [Desulfuromonadales bacterium]
KHVFNLVVTDNEGADSEPDTVTITVLDTPVLVAPPKVTSQSNIIIRGRTVPEVTVIIRNGSQETNGNSLPESGLFEIPVPLQTGENQLQVVAQWQGVESEPAGAAVSFVQPTIVLDSVSPATGQAGSILELTGSGFTQDKGVMGVYLKGTLQEAEGLVLEATENTMKVVVPFVFLKTEDDQVQVYVYDDNHTSNSVVFHVSPAADPTPAEAGNEMTTPFERIVVQLERISTKMEQVVKPHVTEEKWAPIEENLRRLHEFVQNGQAELLSIYDSELLNEIDAVFGGDIFLLVAEKLEQINEILNHSCDGEAICAIDEAVGILGDIIDILEWVEGSLIAAEVICFFVCQGALPVIETVRSIVSEILNILEIIHSILNLAPSDPEETAWWIDVVGPYPGVSPNIMFTELDYDLILMTDFSNG